MTVPTQNKLKSTAIAVALGGLLVAASGLAYHFCTPKSYRATAKIKIEKRDWIHANANVDLRSPYDPSLVPAECQLLRSNAILDLAIQNLGLRVSWGKRYRQGTSLSVEEARARLRLETDIHPRPNSSLLEINITSEDPNETAKIANELARVYLAYRAAQRQELIHSRIASLKQEWDQENNKVQAAQTKADRIALEINLTQSTNTTRFYDSDSYQLLQAKRIELETQGVQLRNQLAELKAMEAPELRQVLSSLDSDPNSVLNASLRQLRKAKNDLINAQAEHGADSPELKRAQLVMADLDGRVNRVVGGIIIVKEADNAALKAALDELNEKLKHAKTSTQPEQTSIQNPAYASAVMELQKLKKDRDLLQEKIDSTDANDALMPVAVTAELMAAAETPSRPFTPDRRIVVGSIGTGSGLTLAGVFLLLLVSLKIKPARLKV